MNRAQREALEAANYDMENARRAGERKAQGEAMKGAQLTPNNADGCAFTTEPEFTAAEMRAIMERRTENNRALGEAMQGHLDYLRDQSESDAVALDRLHNSRMEADTAMDAIRNGLRFMQAEWGPLLNAMFQRQAAAEGVVHEIILHSMKPDDRPLRDLASKLLRILRNEPEPKEPPTFYWCPTCKRHVHPADVGEKDGNLIHVHKDGEGVVMAVCPEPVEKRTKWLPDRRFEATPQGAVEIPTAGAGDYLASVDAEFARLGATRTEADAVAIETCRADGVSPQECARALYEEALKRASGPKDTQTAWNVIQGAWMQAAEKSLKESLTRFREYAAMVDEVLKPDGFTVRPEDVELVTSYMNEGREPGDCAQAIREAHEEAGY